MTTQLKLFQVSQIALKYKQNVINTLICEQAENLTDKEIELAFSRTCLPTKLTQIAKELRDAGIISENDIRNS